MPVRPMEKTPLPSTTQAGGTETGAGGWGNNEIQNYISVYSRNWHLCWFDKFWKIIAKKVTWKCCQSVWTPQIAGRAG